MSTDPSDLERYELGASSLLGEEPLDLGDLLNTVLDRGAVVHGEVTIAVADVDLIRLNIGLLLQAIATAEERMALSDRKERGSLSGAMGTIPHKNPFVQDAPVLAKQAVQAGAIGSADGAPRVTRDLNTVAQGLPERINADVSGPESGLARLVLTLIEVLRKVLEHQAVRRMEGGRLSEAEVERLGLALERLGERMSELSRVFGLTEKDLQIDLGPLGRLK